MAGNTCRHFKHVPLTIVPDNQLWSDILDMSLADNYTDPIKYLENQLKSYIYKFENWNDNYYFDGNIYIWFSVVTELSFFGPEIRFFDKREPWLEGKPILDDKEKLQRMDFPDFYKSGYNKKIQQYYEVIGEALEGELDVYYPNWYRGPFCIAAHLRGLENILIDMITDPDFVHSLMRYIVDSSKNWMEERKRFLKIDKIPLGKLYNDEIGEPTLSPKLYEEFILPYEIELAKFQNGMLYWHSCNNTTNFFRLVKKIPGLQMIHVSPWADDEVANDIFKDEIAIDRCLNSEHDVQNADQNRMEEVINSIVNSYGEEVRYSMRVDGITRINDIDYDLKKIKKFTEVYHNIMEKR